MIEYNQFKKMKLEYYRKKYSKYIPFKRILRKIDKNWQIYQYDNSVVSVSDKKKNHNKSVSWKHTIDVVKFYNRDI